MGSAKTDVPPAGGKLPVQLSSRFVARQPILTRDEKVFGYELLFRDGLENCFGNSDFEIASRSVLDSSMLMGYDILCDGRRAFLNCTREVLLNDYITLLPHTHTVVEILETVPPDEQVVSACRRLKESGYLIALDDFGVSDPREPLAGLADIIKVDMRVTSPEHGAAMVKTYGSPRCRMLAEKVETREEFVAAKKAGFAYFQGYFFRRPEMMPARSIPAHSVNHLRMLQAASRPELDSAEIEKLIKSEASLCYRLLRYLNCARFGFANEIRSVRHALSMLGELEVRRWMRLVAMVAAGQNKPSDLVLSALVRARFCELLAPRVQPGDSDLFFMGLLSLMDVILEMPMSRVLESIPLDKETKDVLLGGLGRLRPIYLLMLAQEAGDWQNAGKLAEQLRLTEDQVAEGCWQAMEWARQLTGQIAG